MKLEFQIAAFALHLITSLLWIIPKKMKNYETRFFGYYLFFIALAIISNTLYSIFSLQLIIANTSVVKLMAKLSYGFSLCAMYILFMYILSKTISENRHKSFVFPLASIALFETIVLLILDMNIALETNVAATGYCSIVAYLLCIINVLACAALLFLKRKYLSKWFIFINIVSLSVLLIGVVVEYITEINGVLPLCLANSASLLFLANENPYNKIDNNYDIFKSNYIVSCIDRYYSNKIKGFATYIGIQSEFNSEEAEQDLTKLRKHLISELKTVPELELFISAERDILVLCDKPELFEDFVLDINEVITEAKQALPTRANIKTALVYAQNILVANDGKSLFRHLSSEKSYALSTYKRHSEYYLDEQVIGNSENEEKTKEMIIDAINDDRIEVFYQPIYSSKEKKFTSAEALARIKSKSGKIIMPKVFIQIAENTGLISQIGEKVFEKVCIMLTNPQTGNLEINSIDINLSSVECENPNLANNFITIAKKYKVNPEIINFEVTESNFVGIYDNLSKNLDKMRNFGFNISLDDFGTGQTNLNYLVKVPISKVKIDRHMIWEYFDNTKVKTTVKQLIKLAHDLSLEVVATGVERIAELNEISLNGVDYIQGYYFFKPMPLEEYITFLRPTAFEMDETKKKILKSSFSNRIIK